MNIIKYRVFFFPWWQKFPLRASVKFLAINAEVDLWAWGVHLGSTPLGWAVVIGPVSLWVNRYMYPPPPHITKQIDKDFDEWERSGRA